MKTKTKNKQFLTTRLMHILQKDSSLVSVFILHFEIVMKGRIYQQKRPPRNQKDPLNLLKENSKESFNCYFYRSPPDTTDISPTPSTHTNRCKGRGKSARAADNRAMAKQNHGRVLPAEIADEKNSQIQILRQENAQLKKQLVQIKIGQFYRVDSKKITQMVSQLQQLKGEIQKLKQKNEALRLQNDFLIRTNEQLKMNQKLKFGEEYPQIHKYNEWDQTEKQNRSNIRQRTQRFTAKSSIRNQKNYNSYGTILHGQSTKTLDFHAAESTEGKNRQGIPYINGNDSPKSALTTARYQRRKGKSLKSQPHHAFNHSDLQLNF